MTIKRLELGLGLKEFLELVGNIITLDFIGIILLVFIIILVKSTMTDFYPPQHHQLRGVLKRGPSVRPCVRPSVRIPAWLISSKLFVIFSSNLVHSCRLP